MITVRTAELGDAERMAEIHARTWQITYRGAMPDDLLDNIDVAAWTAARRRWIEGRVPPGEIFVAEADDGDGPVIVGHATVGGYRNEDGTRDQAVGEVFSIYVAPEHWSTGAGYALMRASVDHLAAHGRTEVRLWVLDQNPRARRFYERFGFVADGVDKVDTVGRDGPHPTEVREVRYTLHVR